MVWEPLPISTKRGTCSSEPFLEYRFEYLFEHRQQYPFDSPIEYRFEYLFEYPLEPFFEHRFEYLLEHRLEPLFEHRFEYWFESIFEYRFESSFDLVFEPRSEPPPQPGPYAILDWIVGCGNKDT